MNALYDLHSYSTQHREQVLHEVRLTRLQRRLREDRKVRSGRSSVSLALASVLSLVRGA
jgi:hypothetical protein